MRKPKSSYRHMNFAKAEEIRRLYFSRQATQVQLATQFCIRQGTVSRIISDVVWVRTS